MRSEQTGCKEVPASGAGLPGAWGLTAPSHSLEPMDTSNMSLLPSRLPPEEVFLDYLDWRGGEQELQVIPGFLWCFSS